MSHRLTPRSTFLPAALALVGAVGCTSSNVAVGGRCPPDARDTGFGCVFDPRVAVNSVGYLPDRVKRATVAAEVTSFQVRDASGATVFEGSPTGPSTTRGANGVDQDVWVLDFTEVTEPGEYFVTVEGPAPFPESPRFSIGESVYDPLLHVLMLGMTGQRCGTEVAFSWEGSAFYHGACHLEDASLELVGGGDAQRDGTGGWHDAGDYGKYTVNGAFASGMMLLAWEHFADRLAGRAFDLPEAGDDVPDYLDENRYNLDWLLTMQNEDGSVAHKITPLDFPGMITPTDDIDPRFFSDWGSAGTGDFVAVMAQAARVYEPVDEGFARDCLAAAEKAFLFLQEHPDLHQPDLSRFAQMQYNTRGDADDRAWGSCELWETTGADAALADCEARVAGIAPASNWDWSDLGSLAVYAYVLSRRADRDRRDPVLVAKKAAEIIKVADAMAAAAETNPWGLAYTGGRYWGINGVYARTVIGLRVAYLLEPKPEYLDAATQQIDHLLGRNYYARSQVTGIGFGSPQQPHHRPSTADAAAQPWPGLLIGGAQPEVNSWKDDSTDATTGENAINWNAPLIYAVAGFVR